MFFFHRFSSICLDAVMLLEYNSFEIMACSCKRIFCDVSDDISSVKLEFKGYRMLIDISKLKNDGKFEIWQHTNFSQMRFQNMCPNWFTRKPSTEWSNTLPNFLSRTDIYPNKKSFRSSESRTDFSWYIAEEINKNERRMKKYCSF